MRIISGVARGRKLKTLDGLDTRPTAERVKEAMFSILQFDLEGRRVLDLFAGSGQLGLEALSRGAAVCTFVEKRADAAEIVRDNLKASGLASNGQVICQEALSYLTRTKDRFDLVLLDPPYQSGLMLPALEAAAATSAAGGIIMCETDDRTVLPEQVRNFGLSRTYTYGKIQLWLYRYTPSV